MARPFVKPTLTPAVLGVLLTMSVVDCINMSVLQPYVERMVAHRMQLPLDDSRVAEVVGFLIGIYAICEFIFSLFWGVLADRFGRRLILLIGLAGSAVAPWIMGFSTTMGMTFAARILDGFFCGNVAVTRTYLGEIVTREKEAFAFSLLGMCFSIGQIIGGALGGYLAEPAKTWPSVFSHSIFDEYPYLLPNAVYGTVAAVAWVVGCVSLRESLPPEERRWPQRGGAGSPVALSRAFWLSAAMFALQRCFHVGGLLVVAVAPYNISRGLIVALRLRNWSAD